jgi:hypothetical protein
MVRSALMESDTKDVPVMVSLQPQREPKGLAVSLSRLSAGLCHIFIWSKPFCLVNRTACKGMLLLAAHHENCLFHLRWRASSYKGIKRSFSLF